MVIYFNFFLHALTVLAFFLSLSTEKVKRVKVKVKALRCHPRDHHSQVDLLPLHLVKLVCTIFWEQLKITLIFAVHSVTNIAAVRIVNFIVRQ